MDRAQWLEKALDGGMDINAPQSLFDSWKERAKRTLSTLSERVGTLENHLGAEKTKDILSPLSHFVTLGQQFNPLRWAVDIDAEACLDRLLYHGVDAYEQSKIHESALDLAISKHEWGMLPNMAPRTSREKLWITAAATLPKPEATPQQIQRDFALMLDRGPFVTKRGPITSTSTGSVLDYFPGLEPWMLVELFQAAGSDLLHRIATIFARAPYETPIRSSPTCQTHRKIAQVWIALFVPSMT